MEMGIFGKMGFLGNDASRGLMVNRFVTPKGQD
jgi:hypothetical protein